MLSNARDLDGIAERYSPLPGNRAVLESRHPQAWRRILAGLPASPCPVVEPTADGWALELDGRSIEGASDAEGAAMDLVERSGVAGADEVVVFGFGSGQGPRAALQLALPDSRVTVVVLDPEVFKVATSHFDVTDVLADPRVALLVGDLPTMASVMPAGHRALAIVVNESLLAAVAPTLRPLADMARELASAQRSLRSQLSGVLDNIERNLDTILTARSVGELTPVLAGRAVLLAAPGPSLDRQLGLLGTTPLPPLVTLDTALRPLCAGGVRPDLAVTLDPTDGNLAKFDRVSIDIPLVFFAGARPEAVARSPLPVFACEEDGVLASAHPWFARGGTFRSRGSVLLAALDVLLAVRADPIVLVGTDLAFEDGRSHATTATRGNGGSPSRTLPGKCGGTVRTSESLWRHWRRLNRRLAELTPGRVLDATAGGAEIAAQRIELGEWLRSLTPDQLEHPRWPHPPPAVRSRREPIRRAALDALSRARRNESTSNVALRDVAQTQLHD